MNFVEFIKIHDQDAYVQRWVKPLAEVLLTTRHSDARQKVLQYTAVVHALVETLDKVHLVSKDRPATPNKLNIKSWQNLNYRVFDVYLPFVENRLKYIGPPKRRP